MRSNLFVLTLVAITCAATACGTAEPAWSPRPAPPPPPTVAFVHKEQGHISIVDTTTAVVTGELTLPTPLGPVALSHDAATLAASVPGGIAIADVTSGKILRTLPFTAEISSIAFAGDVLYVTDPHVNEGTVSALALLDGKLLRQRHVQGMGSHIEVSFDGRRLFLGHHFYSGFVTVLEASTLRELASVRLEDGVSHLALSPDERWLFAPNGMTHDGRLTIVDTATNQKSVEIDVPGDPTDVAVFADGTRALVPQSAADTVALIDLTNRKVLRSITVAGGPTNVAVSPDGSRAYVAYYARERISLITLADGAVKTIVLNPPVTDIIRPSRSAGVK